MNSQVTHKSSLPLGIDLDDEVTVKLWNDGSITCIKYGGVGEQDEVPISKEGVAKLVAWLNKHAVEHRVQSDSAVCTCLFSTSGERLSVNIMCPVCNPQSR